MCCVCNFRNMIKVISFLFLIFVFNFVLAQDFPKSIDEVIHWDFKVLRGDSSNQINIVMEVTQEKGWMIFSQHQPEGAVMFPTTFNFIQSENFNCVGPVKESKSKITEGNFPDRHFEGRKVYFVQVVEVKTEVPFQIQMDYNYMAFKEACFPPNFASKVFLIDAKNYFSTK